MKIVHPLKWNAKDQGHELHIRYFVSVAKSLALYKALKNNVNTLQNNKV